ncbi:hypothetical protein BD770DRAFT_429507 [Pilaira anomala]|nr:hypothetical protein BD770DRAFT_429507 [Pilaira anomala]
MNLPRVSILERRSVYKSSSCQAPTTKRNYFESRFLSFIRMDSIGRELYLLSLIFKLIVFVNSLSFRQLQKPASKYTIERDARSLLRNCQQMDRVRLQYFSMLKIMAYVNFMLTHFSTFFNTFHNVSFQHFLQYISM